MLIQAWGQRKKGVAAFQLTDLTLLKKIRVKSGSVK
jgi:hypothetical protein